MSINYSKWSLEKGQVENLLLDPFNPRLSELNNPTQEEIIEQLIKHEDVLSLSLRIAERGFLPSEILIAYKNGNSTYVLEGNRRLAACKLLLEPNKASEKYKKRFQSLSEKVNKDNLKEINLVISPNRKDADYIIAGRHTEISIKKWRLMDQANFYYRRIKDGETIDNLSKSVGVSASKVKRLVASYNMCLRARHLPLSKIAKEQLFNLEVEEKKEKFDLSTLDRIIQSKPGREYLKVSYSENGNLNILETEKDFDSKLKRLIEDIAQKEINSRILSKTESINSYLQSPEKFKRNYKSSINKSSKVVISSDSKSIIPTSIICDIDNDRVKDIFGELQHLDAKKLPNAHAATLRLLLEIGTYIYMERNGELSTYKSDYLTKEAKKSGKVAKEVPDTWPNLKDLIKWLIANDTSIDSKVNKALNKYIDHKGNEPVLDDLNSFMHNPNYFPTKALLSQKWKQLSEYLRHILRKVS
ncbi:MAG: hypothetical protein IMZ60_01265 [Actinobacteria bacterium]|nr:hypothetical protein [Actinomycetota bacterium]